MSQQLAFTYERLARRSDPASSKRAARNFVESGAKETHEQIIIRLVNEHPGWTAKQLSKLGVLKIEQIDRRTKAMEEAGKIRREENGKEDLRLYPA